MKLYGLIGYPLSHSFSEKYFSEKFAKESITDSKYTAFPIEKADEVISIIDNYTDLIGLNVTIPHKESVIHFLNELDKTASQVGAVNTIKIIRSNSTICLKGFNTDVYGFEHSLKPLLTDSHKKALILGTGGASKAIKYILNKLKIQFVSASIEELKENEIRYEDITEDLIKSHTLIINATPLGTYPNVDTFPPIPYEYISQDHILYDLVYNPKKTLFLKYGKEKNAKTINGLKMLHLQAERSWEIWNT